VPTTAQGHAFEISTSQIFLAKVFGNTADIKYRGFLIFGVMID
jgi:hypothetical protein